MFSISQKLYIHNGKLFIKDLTISNEFLVQSMSQFSDDEKEIKFINALSIGFEILNRNEHLTIIKELNQAKEDFRLTISEQKKDWSEEVNRLTAVFINEIRKDLGRYLGDKTQKGQFIDTFEHLQRAISERVEYLVNNTMERFNPDSSTGIPSKLADVINKVWKKQAHEFKNIISSSNPDNPLNHFADDQKRFQEQIEKQFILLREEIVKYMSAAVVQLKTTEERQNTTHAGLDFESAVLLYLREIGSYSSDIVDDVSTSEGFISKCKYGDQVVKLASEKYEVAFTVETKKTTKNMPKSESALVKYMDEVARNRGTRVSVLVTNDPDNLPEGVGLIKIYGDDKIVVLYTDENRETLNIAYRIAALLSKIHSKNVSQENQLDKKAIEDTIKQIKVLMNNLTPCITSLNSIIQQATNAKDVIKRYKISIIDTIDELESKL